MCVEPLDHSGADMEAAEHYNLISPIPDCINIEGDVNTVAAVGNTKYYGYGDSKKIAGSCPSTHYGDAAT